jgi:general L-amino acid transport system ATP-binding protein
MSDQAEESSRDEPIIICRDVHKWYGHFHALKGVSMDVRKREVIVIFGPSGSGKSTFIRTINRLEEHQDGQIIVDGTELTKDVHNIERVRMETGMVFQQFNLFPHLTVLQNVSLAPIHVRKWPKAKAEEIALQLLVRVGIPEQASKFPGQLSGGQQQRVAIARALVNRPKVIFGDEPTGNLDSASSAEIVDMMHQINRETGTTFVLVTHDPGVAETCDRVLHMLDGRVTNGAQPY